MKIAHVVSTFWPKIGGMGEVCRQEVNYLSQAGVEATVFTLRYPDLKSMEHLNFKINRLQPLIRLGDGGLVPQLIKEIKNFDLIHLHYPFYGGAEWVWINKIIFGKKYIVTYHMDAAPSNKFARLLQHVYDFAWAKKILRGAVKVIAIDSGHFFQTKYGSYVLPKNVIEIYNGVNTNIFSPTGSDWASLAHFDLIDKKVILFVGNFIKFKRFDLILNALQLLPADISLVAIGDGYELDNYKEMANQLNLQNRVKFIGKIIDQNLLAKYYSASDCLVVASDYAESFSLVALEAQACETPVIASGIPGVKERVVESSDGYIFTPGNVSDLANKINQLMALSVDERVTMGRNGRKKIIDNYTWDMHGKKIANLYQQLV